MKLRQVHKVEDYRQVSIGHRQIRSIDQNDLNKQPA